MIRFYRHSYFFIKVVVTLLICLQFEVTSNAQTDPKKIHIQEVDIKDSIHHHIQYFIDSVGERDPEFKYGLGYLWLILYENSDEYVEDSVAIRHYELRRYTADYDRADSSFPLFYAVFEGRHIIIESKDINHPDEFFKYRISNKSKRKFKRLIEPFLTKKERVPDEIRKRGNKPYGKRWWRSSIIHLCHCYFKITVFADGNSKARYMEEDL